jgi:hypothetical protein
MNVLSPLMFLEKSRTKWNIDMPEKTKRQPLRIGTYSRADEQVPDLTGKTSEWRIE